MSNIIPYYVKFYIFILILYYYVLLLIKGERMKKIINGKEIDVDVIGGFEIPDLDKKYILCSYDDDKSSNDALVMIYEIENIDGIENLVSIKDEEKELVLKFYESFKESLLEGENNE